jgi:4-azaleucine resistance transporter AzlC
VTGLPADDERESRRQIVRAAAAITLSAGAFGVVYGLAARQAGYSLVEAVAMSVFVLAGASQFAAVGLVAAAAPWSAIVTLTLLLNARHLLYAAAVAPWLTARSRLERALMAHVLTDETFALVLPHFRRIGRADATGYWIASAFICLPWIIATAVGHLGGERLPSPERLGLDIVFPAAMAALAYGLITERREVTAALAGSVIAVVGALAIDLSVGVVLGGLGGPLVALLVPRRPAPSDRRAFPPATLAVPPPDGPEPPGDEPRIGARP